MKSVKLWAGVYTLAFFGVDLCDPLPVEQYQKARLLIEQIAAKAIEYTSNYKPSWYEICIFLKTAEFQIIDAEQDNLPCDDVLKRLNNFKLELLLRDFSLSSIPRYKQEQKKGRNRYDRFLF